MIHGFIFDGDTDDFLEIYNDDTDTDDTTSKSCIPQKKNPLKAILFITNSPFLLTLPPPLHKDSTHE
jgi:hypothetical protein